MADTNDPARPAPHAGERLTDAEIEDLKRDDAEARARIREILATRHPPSEIAEDPPRLRIKPSVFNTRVIDYEAETLRFED